MPTFPLAVAPSFLSVIVGIYVAGLIHDDRIADRPASEYG
jgi:hypothetical protein